MHHVLKYWSANLIHVKCDFTKNNAYGAVRSSPTREATNVTSEGQSPWFATTESRTARWTSSSISYSEARSPKHKWKHTVFPDVNTAGSTQASKSAPCKNNNERDRAAEFLMPQTHLEKDLASKIQAGALRSSKVKTGTLPSVLQEKAAAERRLRWLSSVMFVEECPIQNSSATVALFAKPTCMVQVQVGINSNQLHPHIFLFDIRDGLNIVNTAFLPKDGLQDLDINQYHN